MAKPKKSSKPQAAGGKKTLFITWHYTTHGIAYLKHILTAFFRGDYRLGEEEKSGLSQEELQVYWNEAAHRQEGFLFDKVFYLTAGDEIFDQVSWRRRPASLEDDELMIETGTLSWWQKVHSKDWSMLEEDAYFAQECPNLLPLMHEQRWRGMQYYRIDDQINWLQNISNARELYGEHTGRFEKQYVPIKQLRKIADIAKQMRQWVIDTKKQYGDYRWVINTSLGSYETQTMWFILGEAGLLPEDTHFITTYDIKNSTPKRFKLITIAKQPVRIYSEIRDKHIGSVYDKDKGAPSRILAEAKFRNYIRQGFALLLLGERGTGKTRLILELEKNLEKYGFPKTIKVVRANCASFDDDNKAEADLFGYVKGAFTGADSDKTGLFQAADGGVLFLDEVHHLSKRVQAKLMTALQTNDNNEFRIRRLKSDKEETVKCTIVFASNLPISALRQSLYPDLFDRITQLIVEFPPLREMREELEKNWEMIWRQLRFEEQGQEVPKEADFMSWLTRQDLWGNYRDLQKIAIYYKTYLDIENREDRDALTHINRHHKVKSAADFAIKEFELYYSRMPDDAGQAHPYFNEKKAPKDAERQFKADYARWAQEKFGSLDKAEQYFYDKFGIDNSVAKRTMYDWLQQK